MHASHLIALFSFALIACDGRGASVGPSSPRPGGPTADAGPGTDAGQADAGSTPDAGKIADDAGPTEVPASWSIQSGIAINGADLPTAARSAVAVYRAVAGGTPQLEIPLTDVDDFCGALIAGQCPADAAFDFRLIFSEPTAQRHEVGTELTAWLGDVPRDCRGAGLGFDTGYAVIEAVSLVPGGHVSVRFDLQQAFTGQSVSGTIVAPFCELP